MKKCSVCDSTGNKFPKWGTKCQPCQNQAGYEQKANKFAENRKYIERSKDVPCADCGLWYPTYVMDFDHLPQHKKLFNISDHQRKNLSIQQLMDEVAKCEVVCANCHRIRTFSRVVV